VDLKNWSWGNRQRESRPAFAQALPAKATQQILGNRLWELSDKLVGLANWRKAPAD